ncbi:MAG: acylphosphatase [Brevinematales bacterium]|nr:acylphosphatase [Brevinematales bacterium]
MLKLHAFVFGRVQGVGFRYFVQRNASKLGLKGWVRNVEDGSVEVLAYGDEKSISELLKLLYQGPSMAYVRDVKYSTENVNNIPYSNFYIED